MTKEKTESATFEQLLIGVEPALAEIAIYVRELIFSCHPETIECVYLGYKSTSFGYGLKKNSEAYGYIMPHKNWVNLGFYYGAQLNDPTGLLEGAGKKLRHIKLRSLADAARPAAKALLIQAMAERRAVLGHL